jgi:ABC-type sulfate transport system permease subunit
MTLTENHPFSALARQIDQFLWASILLASAVTAVSLINLGRVSLFMAPSMFLVTLTHHILFLRLASRDRKKSTNALEGTLAPTASKANIILLWLVIALWIIVGLIIIVVSAFIMSANNYEGWERLAGYLELPFVVAEIALLVALALKCRKQRRTTIVLSANVDWQRFGPAATTQA